MKVRFFVLVFALLFLSSCANANSSNIKTAAVTPQPHSVRENESEKAEEYGNSPALTYTQGVALCLADGDSYQLYTACELKNDSDCPCIIKNLIYTVDISGKQAELYAEQPASQYCVVYPGDVTYNAAWHNNKVTESDSVTLVSVKAEVEKSTFAPAKITAESTLVVQNYPAFATVSGDLESTGYAPLNMIYCGFYDEGGSLIGVWCFTEPTEMNKGIKTHFTSHMRSLSIDGLAENVKQVKVCGYGF